MSEVLSDLPLIHSPLLQVPHAFSTRHGGVSQGAFAGLNLDDRMDDPALVAENRRRLCQALGFEVQQLARLNQVHGTEVIYARQAGVWTGDALVTDQSGLLLAIGTADCFPLLLADEQAGVIGAAHAGWKGTLGRIAQATVEAMRELGAEPARIKAAIGTGICADHYPVGPDVARQFEQADLADAVEWHEQQPQLNLERANRLVLEQCGVQQVWAAGGCSTDRDFYSFRRDHGETGRMWAVIGLPH